MICNFNHKIIQFQYLYFITYYTNIFKHINYLYTNTYKHINYIEIH